MYQEWPGNTIKLYAWYQTREIEWCEGWWGVSAYCYNFLIISLLLQQCGRYGILVVLTGEAETAGMRCHGRGPWAVAVGRLSLKRAIHIIALALLPRCD